MKTCLTFAAALVAGLAMQPAIAAEAPVAPSRDWSFSGLFGTFDLAEAQRGLQVYRQVCHSCHSLNFIAFRNLAGIGLSPEQIQAVASEYEVQDGPNDAGDMFMRPGKPSDRIPPPFPNEQAARAANNGALPPDLSLITKARVGGPDYVHALMTGYREVPPEGVTLMDGMYFNDHFLPGHQIAMAPPLAPGTVDFGNGREATVDEQATDVVTFLAWAAEPELVERRRMGVKVILFLIVFTGMLYALKRQIWSDVH